MRTTGLDSLRSTTKGGLSSQNCMVTTARNKMMLGNQLLYPTKYTKNNENLITFQKTKIYTRINVGLPNYIRFRINYVTLVSQVNICQERKQKTNYK